MTKTTKITATSGIILLLFLLSTNPQNLPSILLIVPFFLLFLIILLIELRAFGAYGMSTRGRFRVGLIGAAAPVMLLVLQSLGQLTLRDVLGVLVLFVVAYFYMFRFGARTAN